MTTSFRMKPHNPKPNGQLYSRLIVENLPFKNLCVVFMKAELYFLHVRNYCIHHMTTKVTHSQ